MSSYVLIIMTLCTKLFNGLIIHSQYQSILYFLSIHGLGYRRTRVAVLGMRMGKDDITEFINDMLECACMMD